MRKEIAGAAHSLKSSSANVGANGLSRLLRGARAGGAPRRPRGGAQRLAKVEPEHGRVQTALTAELEQLTAKA